ncbi:aspartate kinase [Candidatus Nitronereus thalassa]|uniref:Aspartokinase n=1 Tax=Candidatus Nitronereus thalassa TaxID=3020898 RepID=A0ABU3K779_9BACT|nr:aspartate kinase [Candidatus Nitronereus thalassa]MDT7042295.1 aspartate kinase [Candidatus Nitronereus thalassa]
MALLVQKFGGTSVGSLDRIHRVAERVEETVRAGHQVLVVLSAMSGETDRLMRLAHEVTTRPDDRELDVLLSSGERVTIALLAMELRGRGVNARSFTGRQVGIVTNSSHTRARIEKIMASPVQQALAEGVVPVVAGFQGVNERSEVTTLGRGGSDLTAVALAASLKADRCVIFTDVDGVYTADPNIVPDARRIHKLSYEEMLELASLGAKVLQARSVEFAAKYGVPVEVKSSFQEGEGTLVTHEDADMERAVVSGVTGDRNQAKVTVIGVPDRPGIAADLFTAVAGASISVDMIIQNVSQGSLADISFTMPRSDIARALPLMEKAKDELGAQTIEVKDEIAKVSIVGVGMRSHSGVASRMFQTLSREGINIMMISTSEIKISCVLHEKDLNSAIRALHQEFGLGQPVDA